MLHPHMYLSCFCLPVASGLEHASRWWWLKGTGLITLEHRCQRGDLIEVFKISKGLVKVELQTIPSISRLSYEERLQKTGLITLEHRRQRGDLIEVFKISKGLVKVDPRTFFNMSSRQPSVQAREAKSQTGHAQTLLRK